MSFLLDDSDTQLFIPEILAMLDFDKASWSMNFVKEEPLIVASGNACESKPKMLRPRPASDTEAKSKLMKRKRCTTTGTPRLRNKDKIELLRHEIESLEEELEALQRSKRKAGVLTTTQKTSVWKGIASRQRRERERAFRCNEGLKKRLIEQQMLTMSLSGVLSEWTSLPPPRGPTINKD
ncbi:hypothetical protein JG688_00010783 [Phytophthora aleatoria]|uniref:Uncharacterized protein n=1 Tax=Phytophthora aleatoria TaxID=2496075 RepID=A0A8J5MFC1_9STRA|nr:hypothetical protein JG688_00010783 [Phytophthora aleatoria]